MEGVEDSDGPELMTIPCSLYLKYLSAGGYGIMIGSFVMYFVYQGKRARNSAKRVYSK